MVTVVSSLILLEPSIESGNFPVKRCIGDVVNIKAHIFTDGHDKIEVYFGYKQQRRVHLLKLK